MCGNILGLPTPKPPKVAPAPTKTDADVADEAAAQRQRLAYSQFGLESLFGPASNEDDMQVKKITLGA